MYSLSRIRTRTRMRSHRRRLQMTRLRRSRTTSSMSRPRSRLQMKHSRLNRTVLRTSRPRRRLQMTHLRSSRLQTVPKKHHRQRRIRPQTQNRMLRLSLVRSKQLLRLLPPFCRPSCRCCPRHLATYQMHVLHAGLNPPSHKILCAARYTPDIMYTFRSRTGTLYMVMTQGECTLVIRDGLIQSIGGSNAEVTLPEAVLEVGRKWQEPL